MHRPNFRTRPSPPIVIIAHRDAIAMRATIGYGRVPSRSRALVGRRHHPKKAVSTRGARPMGNPRPHAQRDRGLGVTIMNLATQSFEVGHQMKGADDPYWQFGEI